MGDISDLSVDRTFCLLGRGQLPVSPEKLIVYGLFFIGIVIFVNWLLSITVIVVKPFLYAALMLAVLRPELVQMITTDENVIRFIQMTKTCISSFGMGLAEVLQFNRRIN